jgi:hypothetical protein
MTRETTFLHVFVGIPRRRGNRRPTSRHTKRVFSDTSSAFNQTVCGSLWSRSDCGTAVTWDYETEERRRSQPLATRIWNQDMRIFPNDGVVRTVGCREFPDVCVKICSVFVLVYIQNSCANVSDSRRDVASEPRRNLGCWEMEVLGKPHQPTGRGKYTAAAAAAATRESLVLSTRKYPRGSGEARGPERMNPMDITDSETIHSASR